MPSVLVENSGSNTSSAASGRDARPLVDHAHLDLAVRGRRRAFQNRRPGARRQPASRLSIALRSRLTSST